MQAKRFGMGSLKQLFLMPVYKMCCHNVQIHHRIRYNCGNLLHLYLFQVQRHTPKGGACLNRILNNQTVYMVIRLKLTTLQVVNLKAQESIKQYQGKMNNHPLDTLNCMLTKQKCELLLPKILLCFLIPINCIWSLSNKTFSKLTKWHIDQKYICTYK